MNNQEARSTIKPREELENRGYQAYGKCYCGCGDPTKLYFSSNGGHDARFAARLRNLLQERLMTMSEAIEELVPKDAPRPTPEVQFASQLNESILSPGQEAMSTLIAVAQTIQSVFSDAAKAYNSAAIAAGKAAEASAAAEASGRAAESSRQAADASRRAADALERAANAMERAAERITPSTE